MQFAIAVIITVRLRYIRRAKAEKVPLFLKKFLFFLNCVCVFGQVQDMVVIK